MSVPILSQTERSVHQPVPLQEGRKPRYLRKNISSEILIILCLLFQCYLQFWYRVTANLLQAIPSYRSSSCQSQQCLTMFHTRPLASTTHTLTSVLKVLDQTLPSAMSTALQLRRPTHKVLLVPMVCQVRKNVAKALKANREFACSWNSSSSIQSWC